MEFTKSLYPSTVPSNLSSFQKARDVIEFVTKFQEVKILLELFYLVYKIEVKRDSNHVH